MSTDGRLTGVAILGSTGSIGTTALRVLERQAARFRVAALTAYANAPLLEEQARRFSPSYVGIVHNGAPEHRHWSSGERCLVEAATRDDVDIVLNAVVGAAGLDATLSALEAGKRVALANKETLVLAGELAAAAALRGGGEIVPVDSEHSAILQCIAGRPGAQVRRVILTASGGPFRGWTHERIEAATLDDALRHPTWSMGRKITVDCATLANKALEVIEAHHLFGLPYERIEVVVHPQSVVHSFVEFVDGSVLAQMGTPTMELPVLYALTHPDRVADAGLPPFDPVAASPLTFESVRHEEFPALRLGCEAGRRGGAAPAVFNAANEEAVALFLERRIRFVDVPRAIESALGRLGDLPGGSRDSLLSADAAARRHVRNAVMLAWLAPIIVFGLVVFVHELGHFLAAKAVGVYAPRFSIGFGPALWRRRWGETEYVLAALPLGGYVRMASRDDEAVAFLEGGGEGGEVRHADPEHPNEVAANGAPPTAGANVAGDDWDPNAMAPFGPKPVPENRWFESRPLPARLLIMIAGVTMNVLLALVVSIGVFAGYGRPFLPAVVDSVIAERPAARAGMQRGDSIVAIGGERIERWTDMVERIASAGGRAITIDVVRGGQPVRLDVTPEPTEVTNPLTGKPERIGRIGVAPDTNRIGRERLSAGEAVASGWHATWAIAGSVVTVVRGLFSGQVSVEQLGGPVAIASASVQAARGGLEQLLSLVAFLSVNIAILNLLPVPVLDGGQIVLNLLEAAKGSAFSARTRGYILRAGLLAIALLFVLVMFNDLKGVVERLR